MRLVIVKNNELDEPFCYADNKSYTISETYDVNISQLIVFVK